MAKSHRSRKQQQKGSGRSDRDSTRGSRASVGGPAAPASAGRGDVLADKVAGTQELASTFPFNPNKAAEYDPKAALAPPKGVSAKPDDPIVGASTVSESNGSEKAGSGGPHIGHNPTVGPLDRVRVDSTDRALTTNQGVPIADNQSSLKAGLRGPTLLEDFILREKITHFDHERIPERIVHARGSAAHGYFECTQGAAGVHARLAVRRGGQADAGLRPLLDRARRARLDRHRPRRARLRGEVLHGRGQLGSRRQQHPGVLHPGRDEVPRSGARGQAGAALRDAAGRVGARHVLGLRVADAGDHPHADVGDVRSRDSAQLPDDAGVRRAHLPAGQRRRASRTSSSSTGRPRAGTHSLVWDEAVKISGADSDFHRRDLWEAIEAGAYPGVRARAADLHRGTGRGVHASTCSTRRRSCPRSWCRSIPVGRLVLNRNPDNFFAETEQVAFCVAHVVPGIDFSNDPLLAGRIHSYVDTQISRLGGPNFHEIPINAPVAQVHNNQRDGMHRQAIHRGRVSYEPNSLGGGCPFQAGTAGFVSFPERREDRRSQGARQGRAIRRSLHAGDAVLEQPDATSRSSTSSTPSASSCRACRRRRSASGWCPD